MMKRQQNIKIENSKIKNFTKPFFSLKNYEKSSKNYTQGFNGRYSLQKKRKMSINETKAKQIIDNFDEDSQSNINNLRLLSDVMSEKQFSKLSLFQTVKKTKGQFYFKNIYQKSKYMQIHPNRIYDQILTQRKYFIYILQGQINLYKYSQNKNKHPDQILKFLKQTTKSQTNLNKCYIRSYIVQEHFGYQQYPLYWKQKLILESPVETKLILFPLDSFYKIFNNIISLAAIQITAEFFKKVPIFREVQMEKLLRISTFCKRIRTYPNTLIVNQQEKINHIILLYDGRVSLSDTQGFYKEQKNGLLIGKKQVDCKKDCFQYQIKALIQCDLIVIPLSQFSKVSQIRHKLKDSVLEQNDKVSRSRKKDYSNLSFYQNDKKYSITGYQTLEQRIFKPAISTDAFRQGKSNTFMIIDSSAASPQNIKNRPKTASNILSKARGPSKSVGYTETGRHFFVNRSKTSMDQRNEFQQRNKMTNSGSISKEKNMNFFEQVQNKQPIQNVTMGQICWAKFLNRKMCLQNKQIAKIINAKLPQTVQNVNKQYAVMKAFSQKKSTYIKNYKRKMKHSHKINQLQLDNVQSQIQDINLHLKVQPMRQTKTNFKSF